MYKQSLRIISLVMFIISGAIASEYVTDRFGNRIEVNQTKDLGSKISINGQQLFLLAESIKEVKTYVQYDLTILKKDFGGCTVSVIAAGARNFYLINEFNGGVTCTSFELTSAGFIVKNSGGKVTDSFPFNAFRDFGNGSNFINPFFSYERWIRLLTAVYGVYILSENCETDAPGDKIRAVMKGMAIKIEAGMKEYDPVSVDKNKDLFSATSEKIEQAVNNNLSTQTELCQADLALIQRETNSALIQAPNDIQTLNKKPW